MYNKRECASILFNKRECFDEIHMIGRGESNNRESISIVYNKRECVSIELNKRGLY